MFVVGRRDTHADDAYVDDARDGAYFHSDQEDGDGDDEEEEELEVELTNGSYRSRTQDDDDGHDADLGAEAEGDGDGDGEWRDGEERMVVGGAAEAAAFDRSGDGGDIEEGARDGQDGNYGPAGPPGLAAQPLLAHRGPGSAAATTANPAALIASFGAASGEYILLEILATAQRLASKGAAEAEAAAAAAVAGTSKGSAITAAASMRERHAQIHLHIFDCTGQMLSFLLSTVAILSPTPLPATGADTDRDRERTGENALQTGDGTGTAAVTATVAPVAVVTEPPEPSVVVEQWGTKVQAQLAVFLTRIVLLITRAARIACIRLEERVRERGRARIEPRGREEEATGMDVETAEASADLPLPPLYSPAPNPDPDHTNRLDAYEAPALMLLQSKSMDWALASRARAWLLRLAARGQVQSGRAALKAITALDRLKAQLARLANAATPAPTRASSSSFSSSSLLPTVRASAGAGGVEIDEEFGVGVGSSTVSSNTGNGTGAVTPSSSPTTTSPTFSFTAAIGFASTAFVQWSGAEALASSARRLRKRGGELGDGEEDGTEDGSEEDEGGRARARAAVASVGAIGHRADGNGRKKARLRSRNSVIDRWLGADGGDETFADLEDFLVAGSDED